MFVLTDLEQDLGTFIGNTMICSNKYLADMFRIISYELFKIHITIILAMLTQLCFVFFFKSNYEKVIYIRKKKKNEEEKTQAADEYCLM